MCRQDKLLILAFVAIQCISLAVEIAFITCLMLYFHLNMKLILVACIAWFFFAVAMMLRHYDKFHDEIILRRRWIEHGK